MELIHGIILRSYRLAFAAAGLSSICIQH